MDDSSRPPATVQGGFDLDILLKGIMLAFLLWYVRPGLNFLVINIFLPLSVLNPGDFINYSSLGSLIVLFGTALVIGFVMDSLKLYQFTLGYRKKREGFFQQLGQTLSVSAERAREVFGQIRAPASIDGPRTENLGLEHSRWVMLNHTSKCFYLLVLTWVVVLYAHQTSGEYARYFGLDVFDKTATLLIDLAITRAAFLIGLRLSRISSDHLAISNQWYLDFVARNKN